MWARVLATFLAGSVAVFSQQQQIPDPAKKETENIGRKHQAPAPEVEKPQEIKKEEPPKEIKKEYAPPQRRGLNLGITRAQSIVEKKTAGQVQPQKESNSIASLEETPEPISGVCVVGQEIRVRNFQHYAELPCLLLKPESRLARVRAVFTPDARNLTLRGKLLAIDGREVKGDIPLLRGGSEHLPSEVKRFILANALVYTAGQTTSQTADIVRSAAQSEVNVQIGSSGISVRRDFTEVLKNLPVISGVLAVGNFFQGLARAAAPQGQIPPEFIIPSGTELYFSRP